MVYLIIPCETNGNGASLFCHPMEQLHQRCENAQDGAVDARVQAEFDFFRSNLFAERAGIYVIGIELFAKIFAV